MIMTAIDISIVCVPRERFGFAQESLESLYENTSYPFRLVYVDNGLPHRLRSYLTEQSRTRCFDLLRTPHFLSPNQARNFGFWRASGRYVVFIDNDVVFAKHWLEALVDCAEITDATVVAPIVCQHEPDHEIVHCAGGEYMPIDQFERFRKDHLPLPSDKRSSASKWSVREKIYLQGEPIARVGKKRKQVGFVEFHCLMIRREFLYAHGGLDEGFLATKEYIDLAMTVARSGGSIWIEPESRVTFRTHPPQPVLSFSELPYFLLRWSDDWEIRSLKHMIRKWDLMEDEYFLARYAKLGWRRRTEVLKPMLAKLRFLGKHQKKWLKHKLVLLERRLNRYLVARHATRASKSTVTAANYREQESNP